MSAVLNKGGVAPTSRRRHLNRRRQTFWATLFLLPALVALAMLRLSPIVTAVSSSLYKAFPGGIIPATFAGLANYHNLFADKRFLSTIWRTIAFNAVINPLQILLALFVAVLMTRRIAFAGLWRTLVFVPVTIPIVGSCIAWGTALQPDGPVNALLSAVGAHGQPFLTSPRQALACIILVASWIGIGYWMLFLIAGLQAIPVELYEAAQLDQAGPFRCFLQITLPLLKRPLLFVLVADTVANFVLFVPVQLLTAGGPQNSTNLLMFDAYRTTFGYGSRNLGSAEVVILTAIMLVFVLVQFRLLRQDSDAA